MQYNFIYRKRQIALSCTRPIMIHESNFYQASFWFLRSDRFSIQRRHDLVFLIWKNVDNVIGRIKRNARLLEEFYLNDFKTTLRNIPGQLIFENVEFQRL